MGERDFYLVPDARDYYSITVFTPKNITGKDIDDLRHRMRKYHRYFIRDVVIYDKKKPLFRPLANPGFITHLNSIQRLAVCDVFMKQNNTTYGVTAQHALTPGQDYHVHCAQSANMDPVQPLKFRAIPNPDQLQTDRDIALVKPNDDSSQASVRVLNMAQDTDFNTKYPEIKDISLIRSADELGRYTDLHFRVDNERIIWQTPMFGHEFETRNFYFTFKDNR